MEHITVKIVRKLTCLPSEPGSKQQINEISLNMEHRITFNTQLYYNLTEKLELISLEDAV
jgi:hypothetical protein